MTLATLKNFEFVFVHPSIDGDTCQGEPVMLSGSVEFRVHKVRRDLSQKNVLVSTQINGVSHWGWVDGAKLRQTQEVTWTTARLVDSL